MWSDDEPTICGQGIGRRELAALILASALITLDGTAATVALPAIGRDLSIPISRLQWISNAALLTLAAVLLPAGAAVDRLGRYSAVRVGLLVFAAGSAAAVMSPAGGWLIGSRAIQGFGAALILPAALAALRAAFTDPVERTRVFGVWAAWTGVAAAAGPLLGGALVDLGSWRAVFAMSGVGAFAALALLGLHLSARAPARQQRSIPVASAAAAIVLLGTIAFILIEATSIEWDTPRLAAASAPIALGGVVLRRSSGAQALLPRELVRSHNCLPANVATSAFYFGMFGLSFLLVLYTQQVLGYSGTWAGVVLLPISVMLFGAGLFGRITERFGSRVVVIAGACIAAAGVLWLATGAHPLPFWTRIIVGTSLFGLGISISVAPLTQAAVSAVPEACAGAASGLNHATVRVAGLVAIAVLGSLAARGDSRDISPEGLRSALLVCAAVVGLVGVAGGALVRDDRPGGLEKTASD